MVGCQKIITFKKSSQHISNKHLTKWTIILGKDLLLRLKMSIYFYDELLQCPVLEENVEHVCYLKDVLFLNLKRPYLFSVVSAECMIGLHKYFYFNKVWRLLLFYSDAQHTALGKMWPWEAFNLAPKSPNLVCFASFFDENSILLNLLKNINFGPPLMQKNFFGPLWDLSCAPLA